MNMKNKNQQKLVTYEELHSIIEKMRLNEFTVLDVYDFIENNEEGLFEKLKQYYSKERGYSQLNYLSNLLLNYSKQEDSLLQLHIRYDKDKKDNIDFRKPSDEEKKRFKSTNIAIYRCKKEILRSNHQ